MVDHTGNTPSAGSGAHKRRQQNESAGAPPDKKVVAEGVGKTALDATVASHDPAITERVSGHQQSHAMRAPHQGTPADPMALGAIGVEAFVGEDAQNLQAPPAYPRALGNITPQDQARWQQVAVLKASDIRPGLCAMDATQLNNYRLHQARELGYALRQSGFMQCVTELDRDTEIIDTLLGYKGAVQFDASGGKAQLLKLIKLAAYENGRRYDNCFEIVPLGRQKFLLINMPKARDVLLDYVAQKNFVQFTERSNLRALGDLLLAYACTPPFTNKQIHQVLLNSGVSSSQSASADRGTSMDDSSLRAQLAQGVALGREPLEQAQWDGQIKDVGIITYNRPEQLARAINSYIDSVDVFGRKGITLTIFDDSNDAIQKENLTLIDSLVAQGRVVRVNSLSSSMPGMDAPGNKLSIRYIGPDEKQVYLAAMAEELEACGRDSGQNQRSLGDLLGTLNDSGMWKGAAAKQRNWAHLWFGGERALLVDDDTQAKALGFDLTASTEALQQLVDTYYDIEEASVLAAHGEYFLGIAHQAIAKIAITRPEILAVFDRLGDPVERHPVTNYRRSRNPAHLRGFSNQLMAVTNPDIIYKSMPGHGEMCYLLKVIFQEANQAPVDTQPMIGQFELVCNHYLARGEVLQDIIGRAEAQPDGLRSAHYAGHQDFSAISLIGSVPAFSVLAQDVTRGRLGAQGLFTAQTSQFAGSTYVTPYIMQGIPFSPALRRNQDFVLGVIYSLTNPSAGAFAGNFEHLHLQGERINSLIDNYVLENQSNSIIYILTQILSQLEAPDYGDISRAAKTLVAQLQSMPISQIEQALNHENTEQRGAVERQTGNRLTHELLAFHHARQWLKSNALDGPGFIKQLLSAHHESLQRLELVLFDSAVLIDASDAFKLFALVFAVVSSKGNTAFQLPDTMVAQLQQAQTLNDASMLINIIQQDGQNSLLNRTILETLSVEIRLVASMIDELKSATSDNLSDDRTIKVAANTAKDTMQQLDLIIDGMRTMETLRWRMGSVAQRVAKKYDIDFEEPAQASAQSVRKVSNMQWFTHLNVLANYTGEVDEYGRPHGEGQAALVTQKRFSGTWYEGRLYRGQYFDHRYNTFYEGPFLNYKRHGVGELFFPSGKKYIGEFKDDLFDGNGRFVEPDGRIYAGTFLEGQVVTLQLWT